MNLGLFIFRRDLRVFDNTGLIKACSECKKVIPLFILTPQQVGNNKYKSSNAIQFMMESLKDLNEQLGKKLRFMYDDEIDAIKKIYNKNKFDSLYINSDYTPYSIKRDKRIEKWCKDNDVNFVQVTDILLLDTNEITTLKGTHYKIFTQFYKSQLKKPIRKPNKNIPDNFVECNGMKYKEAHDLMLNHYEMNDMIAVHGGRDEGLGILKKISSFKKYATTRNSPSLPSTMLSAHNHFGTVSIREVYAAFAKTSQDLVQQLYWRDFYYYIGIHFPDLWKYKHLAKKMSTNIKWENNKTYLLKWQKGMTGFPIVDAAMRQMNTTGFMHNRCRMIVAMFLCKDLLIDWKYGEQYFSKKLVDIDRAQNIGNWNWSSTFGLDNASFIRIFNPWEQSSKADPDCEYIYKWVPELKDVPADKIHKWNESYQDYEVDYPQPIIDHSERRKIFLTFYKKYFS